LQITFYVENVIFIRFKPPIVVSQNVRRDEAVFTTSVNVLCQNGLMNLLEDWFFEAIQQDLRERVSPTFWGIFSATHVRKNNDDQLKKVAGWWIKCQIRQTFCVLSVIYLITTLLKIKK